MQTNGAITTTIRAAQHGTVACIYCGDYVRYAYAMANGWHELEFDLDPEGTVSIIDYSCPDCFAANQHDNDTAIAEQSNDL